MTRASQWRELARRTGDDVEVAILWNRDRLKVAVIDGGLCHHLDFDLADDRLGVFAERFGDAARQLRATDLSAALSPRAATDEFWGFSAS